MQLREVEQLGDCAEEWVQFSALFNTSNDLWGA
jgi:hypothetical protein